MKKNDEKLDKILEIMEFIYINSEKYTEKEIKKELKLSNDEWELFTQFAVSKFAHTPSENKFKLTQEGTKEYHELDEKKTSKIR